MKVTIRVRLAPFWRSSRTRKPRPERISPFSIAVKRRGTPPLAVWAMSVLLMIGFMSMSMFATLSAPPPVQVTIDEEDPSQPIVGKVADDCRVMMEERGKLRCLESVEYREDISGALTVARTPSTPR